MKKIPKIHDIINNPIFESFDKHIIKKSANIIADKIRAGEDIPDILLSIRALAYELERIYLQKIINATGIILHTNLGRAPLAKEAIKAIETGYNNLEYNINTAKRGSRYDHIEDIICELTGAESAIVVNNNAAGVLLMLRAIASKKEVIVSRGELIEIGGSFRIPDIMEESGCILKEIGTTNKTHIKDYEHAINENTAAILKVHTSNFYIGGFTTKPSLIELSKIAKQAGIPLIEDLGSGCIINLEPYGIYNQPTVKNSIKYCDMVCFSGDKLLGGPQAGIIAGKKEYISIIKSLQLTRAMRIDKLSLAALFATLKLYREPDVIKKIPVLDMLTQDYKSLYEKAERLLELFENKDYVNIIEDTSEIGGGAMPGEQIKTAAIAISNKSPNDIEKHFRLARIIGRIKNGEFLLDVRTIFEDEFEYVACVYNKLLDK